MLGKEFNAINREIYIKLTPENEIHNGLRYRRGLIMDNVDFKEGKYDGGGISACTIENMPYWAKYHTEMMMFYRVVTFPEDALIHTETTRVKASKVILGEKRPVADLHGWQDPKFCKEAVIKNAYCLKFVNDQTEELCLSALQSKIIGPEVLLFVRTPTDKIVKEFIKYDYHALEFVNEQTKSLCEFAVKRNDKALNSIRELTLDLIFLAIEHSSNLVHLLDLLVKHQDFSKFSTSDLVNIMVKILSKTITEKTVHCDIMKMLPEDKKLEVFSKCYTQLHKLKQYVLPTVYFMMCEKMVTIGKYSTDDLDMEYLIEHRNKLEELCHLYPTVFKGIEYYNFEEKEQNRDETICTALPTETKKQFNFTNYFLVGLAVGITFFVSKKILQKSITG